MADKPKAVTVESRNGENITVTLVTGKDKGLMIFIPGDFSKPADLDDRGKVKKVISTANWMTFAGVLKGWDLVGGMHYGFAKPRKKS